MFTNFFGGLFMAFHIVGTGFFVSTPVSTERPVPEYAQLSVVPYAEISTTSAAAGSRDHSRTKGVPLPILVYHVVRPSYPSDSPAVRSLALTPEVFDAQMDYLRVSGYRVIRFSDLEAHFMSGVPLPAHPIILSFDDGWQSQFTYALPILEKYRYPATFFVFTNAIGRKGFFTWDELRSMVAAGMTVGGHSRSHPYLTSISSEAELWSEIFESKQQLETELGVSVNEFAYPFGRYNATIVSLVQKAGYRSARGDFYSGNQSAQNLFELSAMNAPTTTALFARQFPAY